MSTDPMVQQVRSIRKEIEQQYPDADSFYEHLRQQQKAYGDRLTKRRPKEPPRTQAS